MTNRPIPGVGCLLATLALLGCVGMQPGDEAARRGPVEYVAVATFFEPRFEWVVTADRSYSGRNYIGGSIVYGVVGCGTMGPLYFVCLPAMLLVGVGGTAISGVAASSAGSDKPEGNSTVRAIDTSKLASALDLQSRLQAAVSGAGWRAPPADGEKASYLRLEARVERVKALSSAPVRNVWVHEIDTSWRLIDPAHSRMIASGVLRHERVLSFSLRFDEASGRWLGEDDGRFSAAWESASREIAGRIVEQALPAIAAYANSEGKK